MRISVAMGQFYEGYSLGISGENPQMPVQCKECSVSFWNGTRREVEAAVSIGNAVKLTYQLYVYNVTGDFIVLDSKVIVFCFGKLGKTIRSANLFA